MYIAIFIGGFLGLFGLIIFLTYLYEKKRTEKLNKIAQFAGFSFTKKKDPKEIPFRNEFKDFNRGHSRTVKNFMQGRKNQISWTIFDYKYTVGSGKHSHTYNYTIFHTKLEKPIAAFILGKENFINKIAAKIGYNDIDFDSHPEFSNYYLLKGTDENKIRQTFNTNILAYFEQNKSNFQIETNQNNMIILKPFKRIKPAEFNITIDEITKIVKLFDKPKY